MWDVVGKLVDDPFSRWVALVIFAVVLAVLVFLYLRKRFRALGEDLGVVKHEVKNDHKTNLRVESDERHEENSGKLDTALRMIATMQESLGRVYDKAEAIEQSVGVLAGRVTTLEDTTPGRPFQAGRHRDG
ncbi:uncharacterized protein DUF2746 [Curtobacterium sp. PhB130]|uniref:DUF2746 domain-containing protein n=1 Tax=unclassified Curtobacterium TaxID=257496 RepID=UPI000F4AFF16|nr:MULTISPECIES: DUF2746 domain-containing protein [unclassified Curtobacterium]ROP64687.1 uncharacterized protein DUF2746 [Curtobacterium sp. ZW137]ROS74987.1 uncharacterized protein DUF2746 [Curtobacterium sp. PhB130]